MHHHRVTEHPLRRLFAPSSIAVVGASAAPGKAGNAMVRSLAGFPGALHLVNPRTPEIAGRRAWPSVAAIGEPIDLAVLVVPAEVTVAALEDCGAAGVAAAVVCAGGFAESAGGRGRQDEALAVCRRHGIRLLGPNTSGFVHPAAGVFANFVPDMTGLEPGPAAIVASSGGVSVAASFLAAEDGLGLRLAVGLGNAADVGFAEVLDYLAGDPGTSAVGIHVEGVDDGRVLCEAVARLAASAPVVALKVGRSDVDGAARSHTGRLLGDFELTRAALRQSGAVVVDDLTEMVDALRALAVRRVRPGPAPGVGIVTGQAGPGLLVADALRSAGVAVPDLAEPTQAGLGRLLPPLTWQRNPVDTGRPTDTFGEVLALVAGDDAIDGLVVYAIEEGEAVDPLAALATPGVAGALPIVFGTGGPRETLDRRQIAMAALGVPLYRSPERAARAMRALVDDARSRHRAGAGAGPVAPPGGGAGAALPAGDRPLDEHEAKAVLEALGVTCPARRACDGREAAHAALDALGAPVVVKVLDPGVDHKVAVGGVHGGVRDHAALDAALDVLDAGPACGRYLVEAEVGPGPELLVGGTRDPSFGPVVALGWGGTGVERVRRPALRLAPPTAGDVEDMVAEVDPELPAAALAPVVRAVAALLAEPGVAEVDLNPVRLTATGPVALDALVVRR